MDKLIEKTKAMFLTQFKGHNPIKIVKAPGRVNLIGGHTDYNEGFVLPVPIDRDIVIVAQARDDGKVRTYSRAYDQVACFSLDNIKFKPAKQWVNYLQGIAQELLRTKKGQSVQGLDICIGSNLPQGVGLGSSAALEVATAMAFKVCNGFDLEKVKIAELCRKAENEFVGVQCGIMDQLTSALGKKRHALFIDCRTTEYSHIPFPKNYKIIIADTRVEHTLVESMYNRRVQECQKAIDLFDKLLDKKVAALRDVSIQDVKECREQLPTNVRKRVQHVVSENNRVKAARNALKKEKIEKVGRLMEESHYSLRDLYEVSCKELNVLIELALEVNGVIGARMTGAGFGGCTVNLVKESAVNEFTKTIFRNYLAEIGKKPAIYVTDVAKGVHEVKN